VFIVQPVLVASYLDKKMWVEADTSEYVTGGVLWIRCEDNKWRLVALISKLLNKAKRNYEIYNWEMLAIMRCLEE